MHYTTTILNVFLSVFVCMCVYVCVYVCVCKCKCVYVCVCVCADLSALQEEAHLGVWREGELVEHREANHLVREGELLHVPEEEEEEEEEE